MSFPGLVVFVGVDGVFGEDLAGGGVGDHRVGARDEDDHMCSGVGPADGHVAHHPRVAQADRAGGIDGVIADSPVPVLALLRCRFGQRGVDLGQSLNRP